MKTSFRVICGALATTFAVGCSEGSDSSASDQAAVSATDRHDVRDRTGGLDASPPTSLDTVGFDETDFRLVGFREGAFRDLLTILTPDTSKWPEGWTNLMGLHIPRAEASGGSEPKWDRDIDYTTAPMSAFKTRLGYTIAAGKKAEQLVRLMEAAGLHRQANFIGTNFVVCRLAEPVSCSIEFTSPGAGQKAAPGPDKLSDRTGGLVPAMHPLSLDLPMMKEDAFFLVMVRGPGPYVDLINISRANDGKFPEGWDQSYGLTLPREDVTGGSQANVPTGVDWTKAPVEQFRLDVEYTIATGKKAEALAGMMEKAGLRRQTDAAHSTLEFIGTEYVTCEGLDAAAKGVEKPASCRIRFTAP